MPPPPPVPLFLLQLIDASFKYPGREDFGMHDIRVGIDMGSRIAIVGPNGEPVSRARLVPSQLATGRMMEEIGRAHV